MRWWLLCCLWLIGLPVMGEAVGVLPESRVMDRARLFAQEPDTLVRLQQRMEEVSARTGFELYAVVFDSLIGTTVSEEAFRLKNEWVGKKPGAVLVLESDSGKYTLGWVNSEDVTTEEGDSVPVLTVNDVAPQDQLEIRQQMRAMRGVDRGTSEAAANLLTLFADGVDEAFLEAEKPPESRWNLRLAVLAAGLLAGMLLIGMFVGMWIRELDRQKGERLLFPEVKVGMRLGAARGGGKVSSRNFGTASSGEP